MPFIKTHWKMSFYKNDSNDGGAMKLAIDSMKHSQITVHSQTKKDGRMWGATDPAHLLNLLEKNHGLYEVITHFPHKVYFDIDCNAEYDPNFLQKIKSTILSTFTEAEFAVSGSITETKTSYHIILSNYLIRNKEERDTIKHIVKTWQQTEPSFDWKVYTPNRNMKCINQSKDDGRIQQIIENPDFRAHLITCFLNESSQPFPQLPEEVELEIKIARAKTAFDLTTLPKMILGLPDTFDLELASPLEILQIFPLNKSFAHDYTHRIARFCFHSKIAFDSFLSWLQNKHTDISSVKQKWQTHWNNLHKFPPISDYQIRAMLKYFYPTITKPKHLLRFQNAFILPTDHIQYIERIGQEHFNVPVKAKIFNMGMGMGKTAQTSQYLATGVKNGEDFIWITPNIALAENTLSRLAEEGIECANYKDSKKFPTHKKRGGILAEQPNLMICADSLHYVMERKYHTVVIDEPETFFDRWYGDFMDKVKGTKRRNWEVLLNIFNNVKSIIFLDAFTSNKSIAFLKHFVDDNYIIYESPEIKITRTVEYIRGKDVMFDMIKTDVNNGMKAFIFYPFKTHNEFYGRLGMADFCDLLETQTGKKGQFYNADQADEIKAGLKNVNKAWSKVDFVITNNMITCGVNYDRNDFDICYLFVASFSQARDILQVSARSRHFSTRIVRICFMEAMRQTVTFLNDTDMMNCPIYTQLYNNVLIEKQSPTKDSIHLLCAKAGYKQKTLKNALLQELQLDHLNLKEKSNCYASFENVERIDYETAMHIENCMFAQCATMQQKFELQKYFFELEFNADASKAVINDEPALQLAWQHQLGSFFHQVRNGWYDHNESIFGKIAVANSYTGMFPPAELFTRANRKKLQIPPDAKEEIFKSFTFKYLTAKSTNADILESIFNSHFKKTIIKKRVQPDKHAEYEIDEIWNEWAFFVKEYSVRIYKEELGGIPCFEVAL